MGSCRMVLMRLGVILMDNADLDTDAAYMEYMLKYDSVHGRFPGRVTSDGTDLMIGDSHVKCFDKM